MGKLTIKLYIPQASATGAPLQLTTEALCPELGQFGASGEALTLARRAIMSAADKALKESIDRYLKTREETSKQ